MHIRKAASEYLFCVLIYMIVYIFLIYLIWFIFLSNTCLILICLPLSLADTLGSYCCHRTGKGRTWRWWQAIAPHPIPLPHHGLTVPQPSRRRHAHSLLGPSFHDPRTPHVLESHPKRAAPLFRRDDEWRHAVGPHSTLVLLYLVASEANKFSESWAPDELINFENVTLVARRRQHFRGVLADFFVAELPQKRGCFNTQEFTLFSSTGVVSASSHALWRVLSNKVIRVFVHGWVDVLHIHTSE